MPLLTDVGRGDWIRTSDLLLPKQVRYQAALRPAHFRIAGATRPRDGSALRNAVDEIDEGSDPELVPEGVVQLLHDAVFALA